MRCTVSMTASAQASLPTTPHSLALRLILLTLMRVPRRACRYVHPPEVYDGADKGAVVALCFFRPLHLYNLISRQSNTFEACLPRSAGLG